MSEEMFVMKEKNDCPKLDGTNWYQWRRKFRALCLKYRCWEAIDGWSDENVDYGAEIKRRKNLSDRCLGLLIETVADAYQDLIDDCEEAIQAYEKLKTECTSYTALHIVQFLDDLVSVKKKEDMSMQQYISEINSHFKKLTECEEMVIPDSVLAGLYLRGLRGDSRYESFIRSLELGAKFVSEEIRGKLVLEEMRMKSMEASAEEEAAVALKAQQKFKPKKKSQESTQAKSTKPNQNNQSNKKSPEGKNTEKKQDRNGNDRFYICYSCGEKGHRSFECPDREENNNEDKKKEDGDKRKETKKKGSASVVNREYKALCASSKKITSDQGVWMLDGGASDHMTSRKDLLRDYVPMSGEVSIGDGTLLKIAGKGKMLLKISDECGGYDLDFSDVLHVPELSDNLVSQGVLDSKGMRITTFKGKTEIYDGKDLFLRAHKVGTLYFITTTNGDSIEDLTSRYQDAKKKASLVTLGTWHNRLGHPHEDALLKIPHIAENFSSRMKGDCEPCIKGKMKSSNIPKEGESKTKVVLARIHSDVCGPIKPTSRGGNKYFVTFIDDHTNYVVTAAMKKKGEVFSNFVKYQRRAENLQNRNIMELQSDNGGEYKSNKFRKHLEEKGIFHRLTVHDHPHQNGKAERQNLTLLNSVRCLLFTSGLPLYFWAEALQTATTLRNFCPSKSIDNKIPYELWNDTEVTLKTLKRLKIFGCQAWAAVDKPGKLGERAEECVFIGYPEGVKGYKLYSLKKQKIILSNDVHFNEKIFPFLLRRKATEEPMEDLIIFTDRNDEEEIPESGEDENEEESHSEEESEEEEYFSEPEEEEYFSGNGSGDEELLEQYQEEIEEQEEQVQEQEEEPVVIPNPPPRQEDEPPRRSTRQRSEKPKCTLECCMLVKKYEENIIVPKTLAQALASVYKDEWIAAMKEEMKILEEMNTWDYVEKTEDMNILDCKWVYAIKKNHAGLVVKFKARLVARGFSQIAGLDVEETYSPVMRRRCMRILIALAVQNDWDIDQVDIISAYLNSPIDLTVYMQQPPHFKKQNSQTHVCRLLKSLYGLKQSGRNWNNFLHQCLMDIGMSQSEYDHCIYYHTDIIVGIHVDDMLVVGRTEVIRAFKSNLQKKMKIKDLGEASLLLSVRVARSNDGTVAIDQSRYIEKILKELDQEDCYTHPAPLPKQAMERELPNETNSYEGGNYRKATGCLQYLTGGTRPDISFSISRLSQYNENPTEKDWSHVVHLLGYLKATQEYGIHYKKNEEGIEVFVDADWGNDPTDARSVTGYVVKLAGGAVSWHSKKQKMPDCDEPVIASSSTHAEYFAMYEVSIEVEWLRSLLTELGQERFVVSPIAIFVDNTAAISLAQKEGNSERTRSINVKYHYVRQLVKREIVKFCHVKSKFNVADVFTKILTGVKTKKFAIDLGLY